ncbi:hypothetical protein BUALT_Bualt13G0086300 [Buddleja alternifolia]|uniref:PB1-like domain-containing protein n=1 Tax=Buddleja alternifolia TaxID=168488 RepID=A0AAV6WWP3_9LAMI|nr:hypothetical protein BUALT_Bualt13G0086300 [Buddleja alternifolia]
MMVNFEIFPNAIPGDKHFTLKIHHGGQLLEIPSKVYVGGEVDYIDYCHPDIMSLCVLNKAMSMLGYQGFLAYYYLTPKSDLNTGLRYVLSDQDTIIMAEIGAQHKHGLIELYVVQPSFTGLLEGTECDIRIAEEGGGQGQCGFNTDGGVKGGLDTDGGVEGGLDTDGGVEGDLDTDSGLEANDIAVSEDDSDIGTSSDELKSLCSDEEDNGETKFIRFNPKADMHDPQFSNGMVFTNALEFKEAVRSHAVVWQRDIAFVKND